MRQDIILGSMARIITRDTESFTLGCVVEIGVHGRNRRLGRNRRKEKVSNRDLEPRPELVGWGVAMLTDVGKTNYPASSGEILIIGGVSLMPDVQ
jgi:hypothetical protein